LAGISGKKAMNSGKGEGNIGRNEVGENCRKAIYHRKRLERSRVAAEGRVVDDGSKRQTPGEISWDFQSKGNSSVGEGERG